MDGHPFLQALPDDDGTARHGLTLPDSLLIEALAKEPVKSDGIQTNPWRRRLHGWGTKLSIGFFGLKNTVFELKGGMALTGDGTAIDSNVTLGRLSGRLETPEESFSLTGWDEA